MIYTAENTAAIGKPARVFVDGKEITHCEMADTDEGYVIAYVVGDDGLVVIDGDEIRAERVEGVVTVEPI